MDSRAFGQDVLVGIELGHYRIVEKIGTGGMGEVYRAHDQHLARDVAIKVLPPGALIDESARKHFHKEALILSQLNHPNIATIYDFDTQQGVDFLVMEYIPGITLSEKVAGGPLPEKEVLRLGVQLAEGLAAAHEHGVVHRDLKPGNLQVTSNGRLKILDFGLAKLRLPVTDSAARESLKDTQAMAGTLPYMAPEQLLGGAIDARTDIHAAGSVLYEMVTGQRPFADVERSQLIGAILRRPPRSPAALNPRLSPELERIIGKCLEKEPENRYQSAKELAIDLRRLLAPSAVEVADVAVAGRKLRKVLPFGVMILVTAAIAGVWYFRSHRTTTRLTDNDIIVVSDFDNKTGDAVFDDTLKQGLSVQLEQSPFLALLSEPRVNDTLKLMGRHAGDRLTPEVTREVCQRTGSKAMLTGSIAALGSQYVIGLKAVNCDTGDVLAQAQEQAAGKEAVLKALDSGVVRLRSKLGESLSSVQKYDTPLEQATTSSLEALQAYSLGVKQQNQSNFSGAIPFLKRATELDPNFAMAYAHLGTSCLYSGQTELAKESYTKAYYLRERVTDRERFHIEGVYYINVTGELKKAAQVDELWKSIYPQDATPNILLCVIYEKLGQYDKELGEAREAFRKRPTAITSWNLVTACIEHGQLEEAKKALADAEVRQLRHEEFPTLSYEIAFLRNDPTEMERIVKAAPSGTGLENDLWSLHSLTAAYYGRVKNAREFLRRTVELARRRDSDSAASYLVSAAVWEATFGNASEARGFAAEGLSLDTRIDVMSRASLAYARAGDLRQAQALADELARKHPTDTILYLRTLPMIRAEIEIKQNNPSRAIEILQNVNPLEMGDLQVVYTRGQAYLLLHRGREATAEFQKILDHPGIVVNDPLGALAYLGMARAHVLRSDYATARIGYEHFFTLWKDADPDIPIYKEAKAEYAKLQ